MVADLDTWIFVPRMAIKPDQKIQIQKPITPSNKNQTVSDFMKKYRSGNFNKK